MAVLGLAFKANIDDVRESPSVTIVQELVRQLPDSTILVVDPNVEELPAALAASGLSRLHGMEEAVAAADLVMLLVDHDEFLTLDPLSLEGKQVIDTKGIWNQQEPVELQPAAHARGGQRRWIGEASAVSASIEEELRDAGFALKALHTPRRETPLVRILVRAAKATDLEIAGTVASLFGSACQDFAVDILVEDGGRPKLEEWLATDRRFSFVADRRTAHWPRPPTPWCSAPARPWACTRWRR